MILKSFLMETGGASPTSSDESEEMDDETLGHARKMMPRKPMMHL